MTSFGGYAVPGMGALAETTEYEILWGGDNSKGMVLSQNGNYSGTIRDAGNTPTTVIRAGLLVGKLTSGAELEEWNHDASDGAESIFGVVPVEFRAQDFDATDQDRVLPVIVRAPFKAASLLIEGVAFVGHDNEFIARHALHAGGSVLDDDPQGYLAGVSWRPVHQNGDITLTSADNGKFFICHTADADFILPTIKDGLAFRMMMAANFELQISSPASIVQIPADATADGVTYTTSGEQQGAYLEVRAINTNGTLLWQITRLVVPFSTDDYLATTIDT